MIDDAPKGHIKIARKSFATDRWWLEPRAFSRWEAWVYVIQLAAWKPGPYVTDREVIRLERGEFVASRRHLAKAWSWTEKRVRHWLVTAQNGARIRAQRETTAGTVYLIVNYDTYQSAFVSEGPDEGPPTGQVGAQQGPKIEAVKAVKAVRAKKTPSASADETLVLAHYAARHPHRRITDNAVRVVRRALAIGYTPAELCEAIDGNATDVWHCEKNKHEISYVLRDAEHIDGFRVNAEPQQPIVDEFGVLTSYGQRLTDPRHA